MHSLLFFIQVLGHDVTEILLGSYPYTGERHWHLFETRDSGPILRNSLNGMILCDYFCGSSYEKVRLLPGKYRESTQIRSLEQTTNIICQLSIGLCFSYGD